ncbi:MAG: 30S ribosome-binding factor RbfA [Candidatus Omnitrophica bacterium]|nr:30S ribosome-binding factor RbfA [Candidatus Omnitrophota bacterium]
MRMDKVNELIKRELGKMILMGDINDPRVNLVTIMSVEVSKDLRYANVKFSVLQDDPKMIKNATEGLESCRSYMRKLIGQRLALRYTPEIRFYFDKGVQYAAQIDMALQDIKKNLPPIEEGES